MGLEIRLLPEKSTLVGNEIIVVVDPNNANQGRRATLDNVVTFLDGEFAGISHTHVAADITDFSTAVAGTPAVTNNTAKRSYPVADENKLSGIAAGAEVNVQADWNAVSGDAFINNKPTTITAEQAAAITANSAKTGITAQQAADIETNNAKVGITPEQAAEITANTAKVGITSDQADAITANTAKVTFPGFGTTSTTALRGDTTLGTVVAANPGGTGLPTLATLSVAGTAYMLPSGGTTPTTYSANLTVTNNITGPSEGYTITNVLVSTGAEGDSYLVSTAIALNPGYEWVTTPTGATFSGTFGTENLTFTHTYTGEVQVTTEPSLSSFTFDSGASEFNVNGQTVPFTITSINGSTSFNISIDMVSPAGWVTTGALSATSGTTGSDNSFSGSITFPSTDMTVNRTARLVATNTADTDNAVNTGLFRQIVGHGQQGDLVASFELDVTGTTISASSSIIGGDEPFTLELFDEDPSADPAPTPLQTVTVSGAASRTNPQTATFTDIDASGLDAGDYTYTLRVTDSGTGDDEDVLIESETITIEETSTAPIFQGGDGFRYTLSIFASYQVGFTIPTTAGQTYSGVLSNSRGSTNVSFTAVPELSYMTATLPVGISSRADNTTSLVITRTDVSPNIEFDSITFRSGSSVVTIGVSRHNAPTASSVELVAVVTNTYSFPTTEDITFRIFSDSEATVEVDSHTVESPSVNAGGFGEVTHEFTGLSSNTQYWYTSENEAGTTSIINTFTTTA